MAAQHLKPGSVHGYQSESDKPQPSTLKRQPNPDWSKNDLLRLLSYFEGELQARDISIATLKAEKAKQLLYQAKYGRFGLGDPFVALQRDAEGKHDTGFDEAAIKGMYDNQLAQLENLIATQRKAQLKMREQLGNSEKRFHKVCTELEDEKKKHAHDTAQGDDVTYMLEKERERLKAEIDFEKSQNKKLEKDLKKTLASLEEERANAARHKQVAIMLIKERKNLIERLVAENQLRDDMESALTDGKSRIQTMAEGLAEESKKSLKMEAALEQQSSKFDGERETLRVRLQEEEKTTTFLRSEVTRLSQQLEALQRQVRGANGGSAASLRSSSASPARHVASASPASPASPNSQAISPCAASPLTTTGPTHSPAQQDWTHPSLPDPSLEFLGPEMANLQQLLASMTTESTIGTTSLVTSDPADRSAATNKDVLTTTVSQSNTLTATSTQQFTRIDSSEPNNNNDVRKQPPVKPPQMLISSSDKGEHSLNKTLPDVVTVTDKPQPSPDTPRVGVERSPTPHLHQSKSAPVLHIYEDQGTSAPSTYTTHHIPATTSVSSTLTNSMLWPPASRTPGRSASFNPAPGRSASFSPTPDRSASFSPTPGQSTSFSPTPGRSASFSPAPGRSASFSPTPQSSPVITSQPLPSGQPLLQQQQPQTTSPSATNTSAIAVGVVAPTITLKERQGWTSPTSPVPNVSFHNPDTSQQSGDGDKSSVKELNLSPTVDGYQNGRSSLPAVISTSDLTSVKGHPIQSPSTGKPTIHQMCATGDSESLQRLLVGDCDLDLALPDGTTPAHTAAQYNHEECLKVLLEHGANPSSLREDRATPLHIAAGKGHIGCMRLLLSKGAAVNMVSTTHNTPLLLAVKSGHSQCCQLLLRHGANLLLAGQDGLCSVHHAVKAGHRETLRLLMDRLKISGVHQDTDTAHRLVAVTDHMGWTLTHMAASLASQDCLVMLSESLPLDFNATDKLGRTVHDVASIPCKGLLGDFGRPKSSSLKVAVELRYILEDRTVTHAKMGSMQVGPDVGWRVMEERLRATLHGYLAQLDAGLRTRRITRMETEDKMGDRDREFTLGLHMASIKQFEMGFYRWTPGMQTDTSPYIILCNNDHKSVTITVDDSEFMCELIAFDVLHPVSSISSYLRLMEQYKSVIFYGPMGSGKSYLAFRLAQNIAAQEMARGRKPCIYQLTLQQGYKYSSFLKYLKKRNCVIPVSNEDSGVAPILILDNLESVDMAELFGELLDPMEYRGIGHAFCLRDDEEGANGMHYLTDHFYVLGTMNKSRSPGVHLSILPRFRWVQFKLDTEPLRGLLARHFLRRLCNLYSGSLPSHSGDGELNLQAGLGRNVMNPEGSGPVVLRAVEWVVCVWQRLNDSLLKLGLPDVVIGPCTFFKCPLEQRDPKLIMEWVKSTWNQVIAPRVREAVKKGTGSEAPTEGQQKVANTALYVLMQRSVIVGCPLSGQEKDNFLSGFAGSNELDIPLRQSGGPSSALPGLASTPGGAALKARSSATSVQSRISQRRSVGGSSHTGLNTGLHTPRAQSAGPVEMQGSTTVARLRARNGSGDDTAPNSNGSSKRRSLSDSNVDKAVKQEQQLQQQQLLNSLQQNYHPSPTTTSVTTTAQSSQAKVARLEVKPAASPTKVINLSTSAFRSPPVTLRPTPTQVWDNSPRTRSASSSSRKSGRVSPLLALVAGNKQQGASCKKSKSSENISSGGRPSSSNMSSSRVRLSPGPFSFSLATPTSKLSSFKFLERSDRPSQSQGSPGRAGNEGKPTLSLADLAMPDFSVFDKVPTPTEDAPAKRSFMFVGHHYTASQSKVTRGNLGEKKDEEEVWSREDVWSKRVDGFVPIHKPTG